MKTKKTAVKKASPKKTITKKVVAKSSITTRTWVLLVIFLLISVYSLNRLLAGQ